MMAASFKHMPQQQSSAVSLDSCYSDLDNAFKSGQASEIHIIMRDIIAELENWQDVCTCDCWTKRNERGGWLAE